jgi:two-component system chemotaxis response regulator CheY
MYSPWEVKVLPKGIEHGEGYFKTVNPADGYKINVVMETGTIIHFDFKPRLNTARFGELKDEQLFKSVYTDGRFLIFEKEGKMPIKISASEFMDLVLIDRRKKQ